MVFMHSQWPRPGDHKHETAPFPSSRWTGDNREKQQHLKPVRVNTPDSVMWPTSKMHRRTKPPIIVSCGQDQASGDVWNINPEPLSQLDDGNDASTEDSPEPPKEPQGPLKDHRLIEVVPKVRPCRQQLDKKTQWTNTNKENLRRIKENLTSIELILEEGLETLNDGQDINQERQKKNEGCCRGWIAKWMGRRKERLRDEDVAREVKRMGEESPGMVSGPVFGNTGLYPLVTSAPRTLAEALRALPSAVAPPSPENVPRPLTPLSPVFIALPTTEKFPYRRSSRLAPITNLSETGPTGREGQ
ncbi:uncharacterized protein LOC115148716 isoform X3 [Salmo trutta]|uniref:uncharacterized protein LOC115148716 isoform X3 n=1 Tax=Salmo trutta TaxID=8032 RepID=UPI001130C144|nr:uncharacterized protein LOC115148716 isoform X3 [Salmo trutta]XP_029546730.1 uncharacterized protein LOC115148716 isoform X3 [Salmo trutta]